MNQCQPIRKTGFVEDLTPLFNGTLNIPRQRKVTSTRKVYRCCSHFDKLDAMNLSLKASANETICLG